jgi:thiamine biosynthesis protein ThiS
MNVTINGESRDVPDGLNVEGLLLVLGLGLDRVAIERNLEILPRTAWNVTQVRPGDRYEIVHFVGGG